MWEFWPGFARQPALRTSHFSTQIEGNQLTEQEVSQAVAGQRFPGRERDATEVRNYYAALQLVEELARSSPSITTRVIRTLHGLAWRGRRVASRYRDGQNVIRDGRSGRIVYLPPEASDVAALMNELADWINGELARQHWPIPILAALAHDQLVTIHPWYDGNGRTARLLTTLILHRGGYGLHGLYSLEEYYAERLNDYYSALQVGPSHNYHEGRANAPVTGFLEYFCRGMVEALRRVQGQCRAAQERGTPDLAPHLRRLDPRQRRVLSLYRDHAAVSTLQIALVLGLTVRTTGPLCRRWLAEGFLELANPARKSRLYRLSPTAEAWLADLPPF
jgi:Fic family protein